MSNLKISKKRSSSGHSSCGIQAEPVAIAQHRDHLVQSESAKVEISDFSLIMNPALPYFGTSLDGYVTISRKDCDLAFGIVEVKSLTKLRHLTPADFSMLKMDNQD